MLPNTWLTYYPHSNHHHLIHSPTNSSNSPIIPMSTTTLTTTSPTSSSSSLSAATRTTTTAYHPHQHPILMSFQLQQQIVQNHYGTIQSSTTNSSNNYPHNFFPTSNYSSLLQQNGLPNTFINPTVAPITCEMPFWTMFQSLLPKEIDPISSSTPPPQQQQQQQIPMTLASLSSSSISNSLTISDDSKSIDSAALDLSRSNCKTFVDIAVGDDDDCWIEYQSIATQTNDLSLPSSSSSSLLLSSSSVISESESGASPLSFEHNENNQSAQLSQQHQLSFSLTSGISGLYIATRLTDLHQRLQDIQMEINKLHYEFGLQNSWITQSNENSFYQYPQVKEEFNKQKHGCANGGTMKITSTSDNNNTTTTTSTCGQEIIEEIMTETPQQRDLLTTLKDIQIEWREMKNKLRDLKQGKWQKDYANKHLNLIEAKQRAEILHQTFHRPTENPLSFLSFVANEIHEANINNNNNNSTPQVEEIPSSIMKFFTQSNAFARVSSPNLPEDNSNSLLLPHPHHLNKHKDFLNIDNLTSKKDRNGIGGGGGGSVMTESLSLSSSPSPNTMSIASPHRPTPTPSSAPAVTIQSSSSTSPAFFATGYSPQALNENDDLPCSSHQHPHHHHHPHHISSFSNAMKGRSYHNMTASTANNTEVISDDDIRPPTPDLRRCDLDLADLSPNQKILFFEGSYLRPGVLISVASPALSSSSITAAAGGGGSIQDSCSPNNNSTTADSTTNSTNNVNALTFFWRIQLIGDRRPERCLPAYELIHEAVLEVQPSSVRHVPPGTRVCAHWSAQLHDKLFPGTVVDDDTTEPNHLAIDFDDNDFRHVPLHQVRMLPENFVILPLHVRVDQHDKDYHPNTRRKREASTSLMIETPASITCDSHHQNQQLQQQQKRNPAKKLRLSPKQRQKSMRPTPVVTPKIKWVIVGECIKTTKFARYYRSTQRLLDGHVISVGDSVKMSASQPTTSQLSNHTAAATTAGGSGNLKKKKNQKEKVFLGRVVHIRQAIRGNISKTETNNNNKEENEIVDEVNIGCNSGNDSVSGSCVDDGGGGGSSGSDDENEVMVSVQWYYFPSEASQLSHDPLLRRLPPGAVLRSDHSDINEARTILTSVHVADCYNDYLQEEKEQKKMMKVKSSSFNRKKAKVNNDNVDENDDVDDDADACSGGASSDDSNDSAHARCRYFVAGKIKTRSGAAAAATIQWIDKPKLIDHRSHRSSH